MSGLSLVNELNDLQLQLTASVKQMAEYGRAYAEKERDYKIALAQAALKRRDAGMPVTLIDKVVYGDVAQARFQRDTAEIMYKTAQESINSIKLRLRLIQAQIDKEWSNG